MRILITGANGFLGKNLQSRLSLRRDIELVFFTREHQPSDLPDLLSGVDYVFHLAGSNRPQNIQEFVIDNIDLTNELCAALAANKKYISVIYASSIQAAFDHAYGLSKRAAEDALFDLQRIHDIPVQVFRLPNVFGKWCKPNYNSVVATFCYNISRGLPISIHDEKASLRLVYVEDLVDRFIRIIDNPDFGARHECIEIFSPQYTITVGELAHQLLAFRSDRKSFETEQFGVGLVKALYLTYLSYLPVDSFAYEAAALKKSYDKFIPLIRPRGSNILSCIYIRQNSTHEHPHDQGMVEKFLVIRGRACFNFRHIVTSEIHLINADDADLKVIESIPGWILSITNVEDQDLVIMLSSNVESHSVQFPVPQFKKRGDESNSVCRIMVLGASGMLGNAVLRYFSNKDEFEVFGTVRTESAKELLPLNLGGKVIICEDVANSDQLDSAISFIRPHVVVNCIGLVKQLIEADDVSSSVPINSLLPHRLAKLCGKIGARLIHMSTDCVFSGKEGNYSEADSPDAYDLYGKSKFLGEVDYPNAITLRTSLIGHELQGDRSLVNWFLSQEGSVSGYRRAIFSGLPTVEVARIIYEYVLPHPELHGLYHLSAEPINKYDLLCLVAQIYNKKISIAPTEGFVIDRSLDCSRFHKATGFKSESWPELIRRMKEFG